MIRKLLFLGGIGAFGYGVYSYVKTQAILLKNSEVDIAGVKLVSQTSTTTTIRVDLKVINNSEKKIIIKSFNFKLYLDGKFIGDIDSPTMSTVIAPNGGNTIVSFNYTLNKKEIDLLGILGGFISKGLKTVLSVNGGVTAKMGFVSVTTPVMVDYTLKELFS